MFYDEITLQNGRFTCTVGETGAIDMFVPIDQIDRTKIRYFKPGETFKLLIGPIGEVPTQEVFGGRAIAYYEVDYFPILNDAEISNEPYLKWINVDLNDQDKRTAKEEIKKDKADLENIEGLPDFRLYKNKIIEAFYFDSLLAFRLNKSFLVHKNIYPIIDKKNQNIQRWYPSINNLFFSNWIKLGLPDFGNSSWEKVHELRQSIIGKDFRRMISDISIRVYNEMFNLKNVNDLANLINQEFSKELINEVQMRMKTQSEIVLNSAINMIPYGSVISVAKDINDFLNDKTSWVSLLSKSFSL
ncbi:MAG: hypothetical protein ABIA75_10440 [Candidatus Neomarinimicrobiota bacterium]